MLVLRVLLQTPRAGSPLHTEGPTSFPQRGFHDPSLAEPPGPCPPLPHVQECGAPMSRGCWAGQARLPARGKHTGQGSPAVGSACLPPARAPGTPSRAPRTPSRAPCDPIQSPLDPIQSPCDPGQHRPSARSLCGGSPSSRVTGRSLRSSQGLKAKSQEKRHWADGPGEGRGLARFMGVCGRPSSTHACSRLHRPRAVSSTSHLVSSP